MLDQQVRELVSSVSVELLSPTVIVSFSILYCVTNQHDKEAPLFRYFSQLILRIPSILTLELLAARPEKAVVN